MKRNHHKSIFFQILANVALLLSLGLLASRGIYAQAKADKAKEAKIRLAYRAIENNQLEQLDKFIKDGVSPHDHYSYTNGKRKISIALFIIAIEKRKVKIVEYLLQNGASPDLTAAGDSCFPVHVAAYVGDLEILKLLIQAGANLDRRGYTCASALTVATKQGNTDIIKLLLDSGAIPKANDNLDSSPLLLQAPNITTRKVLIENGVNVNEIVINGETVLMHAIMNKDPNFVQLLIESGANLELTDDEGDTAIFKAAYLGQAKILEMLLKAGANPGHTNKKGQTALDIAKEEPASTAQLGRHFDYKACVKALEMAVKNREEISPAVAQ